MIRKHTVKFIKNWEGKNLQISPIVDKIGKEGERVEKQYGSAIGYGATTIVLAVVGFKLIL